MKTKILYANFDRETGKSVVKIRNKYGEFTGKSTLHEEDKNHISRYVGCEYAEIKANIKYMQKRIEILNYQIKVLIDHYKNISQSKYFSKNSFEVKKLRRRIFELQKEKSDWKEQIESLHSEMMTNIKNRELTHRKMDKLKKVKNN